ncbi:phage terminase small subunit P27 family, partial [Streptococcus anginosus]|nr:phage terminase small subunit P27 family [Streptococcus anginosus]
MPRSAQSALLQVLEGNPNNKTKKELKKRQKAEKEMLVSAENMTSPSWLDKTAQKEFSRVVDLFKDTTLLNEADIFTIAQYADLTSEFI